jgi:hypothetical protein
VSKGDVFDLLGVGLLVVFGFAVWPPAAVAVAAVAFLMAGRAAHK